jgi:hypothetical protein
LLSIANTRHLQLSGIKWNHPLRSHVQHQVILDVFFAYLAAMRAAGVDMELYKSIQAAQTFLDRNLMAYFCKILYSMSVFQTIAKPRGHGEVEVGLEAAR